MDALNTYLLYFMYECGVCCCSSLGLFRVVSRIISIPGFQRYKQFTNLFPTSGDVVEIQI